MSTTLTLPARSFTATLALRSFDLTLPADARPGAGVTYLLLDTFTDARAAGALNGTAPVPGPGGNRLVTDTGSRAATTLNELRIASGGAAADPVLHYATALTYVPGLCLKMTLRQDLSGAVGQVANFGFDIDNAGFPTGNRFQLDTGGNINIANAGQFGTYTAVGVYASQIDYQFAIILQDTQAVYCIQGGAWPVWTQLGTKTITAGATFYACIGTFNRPAAIKHVAAVVLPYPWTIAGAQL